MFVKLMEKPRKVQGSALPPREAGVKIGLTADEARVLKDDLTILQSLSYESTSQETYDRIHALITQLELAEKSR